LAYWERLGLANAGNRDFNSNLYRIVMVARLAADGYRERQVIEQQVAPSGVDLSQLSSEVREGLAELLIKAKVPQPGGKPADVEPSKPAGLRGPVH
jgi:hypothetical protein